MHAEWWCVCICMCVCWTLESIASMQVLYFSAIVSDSCLLLFSTAALCIDNFQALALRSACVYVCVRVCVHCNLCSYNCVCIASWPSPWCTFQRAVEPSFAFSKALTSTNVCAVALFHWPRPPPYTPPLAHLTLVLLGLS